MISYPLQWFLVTIGMFVFFGIIVALGSWYDERNEDELPRRQDR